MNEKYDSLLNTEFVSLAQAKARLSEKIRQASQGTRFAITQHGRPQAVLLSYGDYLELLRVLSMAQGQGTPTILDLAEWKRDRAKRKKIRNSIVRYFDPASLPRKGQKKYKQDALSKLN